MSNATNQSKETKMKKIIISAVFLFGVSGAAFADMNNKPSDYSFKSNGAGITHAFAAVASKAKSGCDEAAGSEGKIAACDSNRFATPGGTNSGRPN
jgi:hypothetical protein